MAKLFIGYNFIDFTYINTPYKGVLSKIILEEKSILRVDYTNQENLSTERFEASYILDPVSGKINWIIHTNTDKQLALLLLAELEKNPALLELD